MHHVLVVGFAAFVLSRGLTAESAFEGSRRALVGFCFDAEMQPRTFLRGKVGDLLTCGFCLGFWIALAGWAVWAWAMDVDVPRWPAHVVLALAAAGLQGLLHFVAVALVNAAVLADARLRRLEQQP